VPQAQGPDYYTLELLQALLTTGESSRLYRSLVDQQQLAIQVRSAHEATIDPYLFTFTIQPRQGVAPEKAEQALYVEVDKLKTAAIDDHELLKAKNQVISSYYRSLRSINRRANVIGRYQVLFGDYHKLANVEQEFNKVTAADVQRAAKEYFDVNNRTVATLIPTAEEASDKNAPAEEKQ
jgi:predicted Zn-dependent peptidase